MEFRIADTFTDSLARLTQLNPTHPSLQLHKLEKNARQAILVDPYL